MASELPIVCTYESGSVVRDWIDGFIIPVENVEAIKNKILYFYENPYKIKKMWKNGRKLIIENYKWDDFSNRIYDVIKDICEKEKLI
jgi:glycosyltransferase involved in cell wall biosynthesis